MHHIDEGLRIPLIKKIIEDRAGQPDGLSYLSSLSSAQNKDQDYPGIYRSIAGFFSLLIRNNQQDRFADELGKLSAFDHGGPVQETGPYALENDLAWLFGDYEELKTQLGVYDDDDILRSVRDYLGEDGNPTCLDDREVMVLDNPTHFSRIEEDILEGLFYRIKEIWWLTDDHASLRTRFQTKAKPVSGQEKAAASGESVDPEDDDYEALRLFKPVYAFMDRLEKGGFEQEIKKAGNESPSHPFGDQCL